MSTSNFTKPSRIRTTIETAFYGNNVKHVSSTSEAYKLASNSPGTICTDMPIYRPEHLGLDLNSKVLLFNDGSTTGRCADARRIVGKSGVSTDVYASLLRDAIFNSRNKTMYYTQSYIGLDRDFMVKAHLLVPQGYENILYNWLMNFQPLSETYKTMYKDSIPFPDEGDIFVFSDPDWQHVDFPEGLSLFHPINNCVALLGLKYFDKTQDYPAESPDNKFLITAQNCGATINDNGECILVTEDIRNGNGRAIKSKLWAPNRVDKFEEPVNVIIWLMKDPTLPPVIKINNPCLSAAM